MQKCATLVELEKCCQTHIFVQNFVLIQPRTSPPKNCKKMLVIGDCCRSLASCLEARALDERLLAPGLLGLELRDEARVPRVDVLEERVPDRGLFAVAGIWWWSMALSIPTSGK